MVNELSWSGEEGFGAAPLEDWNSETKDSSDKLRSGQIKSFGGLTYLTVERAGHMVPLDKPQESLQMVKNWFSGFKA